MAEETFRQRLHTHTQSHRPDLVTMMKKQTFHPPNEFNQILIAFECTQQHILP